VGELHSRRTTIKGCKSARTLAHAYDKAHYIWYYFSAIGFTSGIALIIYQRLMQQLDTKKQTSNPRK
jgi:hypothetical protein